MTSKNAWAVRPKPNGIDRIEEFLENGMAAIGWPDLGNLNAFVGCNWEKLQQKFEKHYPGTGSRSVGQQVGIVNRFINIKKGDIIAVPSGQNVFFGKVKGGYSFQKKLANNSNGYPHWVRVEYAFDGHAIPREQLSAKLYASLKGRMSVFGIPYKFAQKAIENPDRYQQKVNPRKTKNLLKMYIRKLKAGAIPGVNEKQLEIAVQALLSCYFPGIEQLSKRNAPRGADTDLMAKLPGNVLVRVQVKCYQADLGKLGVDAVEQLRKSMDPGDNGIIVTTSEADKAALKLAKADDEKPIEIIDVNDFAELVFENTSQLSDEELYWLGLNRALEVRG